MYIYIYIVCIYIYIVYIYILYIYILYSCGVMSHRRRPLETKELRHAIFVALRVAKPVLRSRGKSQRELHHLSPEPDMKSVSVKQKLLGHQVLRMHYNYECIIISSYLHSFMSSYLHIVIVSFLGPVPVCLTI